MYMSSVEYLRELRQHFSWRSSCLSSDSTGRCIGNLTTGNEEKTMVNGYVLEPLVLLLEVSWRTDMNLLIKAFNIDMVKGQVMLT